MSYDEAGNRAEYKDHTFQTKAAPEPAPPPPAPKTEPAPAPEPPPGDAVKLPSSIDATGSKDVSADLQTFVKNVPNGSTVLFKAGGTYKLGKVIHISDKRGLTLEGNGATLKLVGPGEFFGLGHLCGEGQPEHDHPRPHHRGQPCGRGYEGRPR